MFCPNCGREVEAAEKFCTQCGAPIEVPAPVKKSGPSRWPKIVGIVGGVVAVVVIIALLIGGIGGTSSPEQTVRAFYRAAERLDASGQAALLAREEYREMWAMTLQMSYDMIDSLSISNLIVTINSQTEAALKASPSPNPKGIPLLDIQIPVYDSFGFCGQLRIYRRMECPAILLRQR